MDLFPVLVEDFLYAFPYGIADLLVYIRMDICEMPAKIQGRLLQPVFRQPIRGDDHGQLMGNFCFFLPFL